MLIGLYFFKNAWLAIGIYHLTMVLFIISDSKKITKNIFKGWNTKIALVSIIMSISIIPFITHLWPYLQLENLIFKSKLESLGLNGISWIIFTIYFSTFQPFLEELFWRGYLKRQQYQNISINDLAFAGYHILVLTHFVKAPWLILAFIILSAVSYIWNLISTKFDGLAIPLLSHTAADISIITIAYILINQS